MDLSTYQSHQALRGGRLDVLQGEAYTYQQVNQAASSSGQVMGYAVSVEPDPAQELMDSMEELSFQFEEKEMHNISNRKLGQDRSKASLYIDAIQKWQKVLPDMPGGEFMERMLRMLRHGGWRALTPQELLSRLNQGSDDATHQYAMLDLLEQAIDEGRLAGEGGPSEGASGPQAEEARRLVQDARALLEKEKGSEVRAGLNLAEQINGMAQTPEEMQNLRQMYRKEVLGFSSPRECFMSLLSSRGAGRLAESIAFLIKSCGIDLQSPSPSMGVEELSRILSDLQCVNVLQAILEQSSELSGKMGNLFGETCLLDGEKITGQILDLADSPFVKPEDIGGLLSACGLKAILARLYFCTELVGMFHKLSPRLFTDNGDRFRLIDAGQEHLDGLVRDAEDEEEEKKRREGRKR